MAAVLPAPVRHIVPVFRQISPPCPSYDSEAEDITPDSVITEENDIVAARTNSRETKTRQDLVMVVLPFPAAPLVPCLVP